MCFTSHCVLCVYIRGELTPHQPIRGQYLGHVISLSQSEASIQEIWEGMTPASPRVWARQHVSPGASSSDARPLAPDTYLEAGYFIAGCYSLDNELKNALMSFSLISIKADMIMLSSQSIIKCWCKSKDLNEQLATKFALSVTTEVGPFSKLHIVYASPSTKWAVLLTPHHVAPRVSAWLGVSYPWQRLLCLCSVTTPPRFVKTQIVLLSYSYTIIVVVN